MRILRTLRDILAPICSLCRKRYFVLQGRKKDLLENLQRLRVALPQEIANPRHIHVCPSCFKFQYRVTCSRCKSAFRIVNDQATTYNSNLEIRKWLRPHNPFYSRSWSHLCPDCYELCTSACLHVQYNFSHWVGGVRSDYIRDFKTIKTLGRVEYLGRSCSEPAEVEHYLRLYSAQLGGNGFVKYYWKKNDKRNYESVLDGYSSRGNPHYHTELSVESWFTGYATAVIAEPFVGSKR